MVRKAALVIIVFALLNAACAQPTDVSPEPPAPTSPPAEEYPSPARPAASPDEPVTSPYLAPGEELPSPEDPVSEDKDLVRGEVFIDSSSILTLESFPPQFQLQLSGSLPTPCHELRVDVPEPDENNQIMVEAYSVVDPEMMCVQVIEPFEEGINLGSFETGAYTVFVNGAEVGQLQAP